VDERQANDAETADGKQMRVPFLFASFR